jgi:plasmid stabilization system protein ParE
LAAKMLKRIRHPIKNLITHPYLGTSYRKRLRRLVVADGLFLVFYRVEQETIQIVHIRRAEQDLI